MPETEKKFNPDTLRQEIEEQFATFTPAQLNELYDGYENRGIDCVLQRNYLPSGLDENSPIKIAIVAAKALQDAFHQLETITEEAHFKMLFIDTEDEEAGAP